MQGTRATGVKEHAILTTRTSRPEKGNNDGYGHCAAREIPALMFSYSFSSVLIFVTVKRLQYQYKLIMISTGSLTNSTYPSRLLMQSGPAVLHLWRRHVVHLYLQSLVETWSGQTGHVQFVSM